MDQQPADSESFDVVTRSVLNRGQGHRFAGDSLRAVIELWQDLSARRTAQPAPAAQAPRGAASGALQAKGS